MTDPNDGPERASAEPETRAERVARLRRLANAAYDPEMMREADAIEAMGEPPSAEPAAARGVVDLATQEPINGPLMQALLSALRDACGDTPEDVALRVGPIPARKEVG